MTLVSDGFLLSLSMCKRGFHDLLRVRPYSLLMLCGCISSSMASLESVHVSSFCSKEFCVVYFYLM